MNYDHAPRAPSKSSHDSTATDTRSRTSTEGLLGLQGTWGNQAIQAMIAARDAAIPSYVPLAEMVANEGWNLLLDPCDALARERGRMAWAGRMTVLEDGQTGTGAPNEVTSAEMVDLVTLYADIENGNGDLRIDTEALGWFEAGAFQDGVMEDVVALMQTRSGRQLLHALVDNENGHVTTIARADTAAAAREVATDKKAGMGENGASGTDTRVAYVPGETVTTNPEAWGTYRSDVVLAHELTHAMYDTQGQTAEGVVPLFTTEAQGDDGVVMNWEHQATGLRDWRGAPVSENAYRAERAALAGTTGALSGDQDMPRRPRYLYNAMDRFSSF